MAAAEAAAEALLQLEDARPEVAAVEGAVPLHSRLELAVAAVAAAARQQTILLAPAAEVVVEAALAHLPQATLRQACSAAARGRREERGAAEAACGRPCWARA